MSLTFPESCYLLVQKDDMGKGKIYVVKIDDELYVKRLQKLPN